jgi:NADH-quinone oxidoreductase subunit N
LTAGFLGKFYVLGAGVEKRQWLLLGAIVAGSAVGLYFYLRTMIQLYLPPEAVAAPEAAGPSAAESRPLYWARDAGASMLIVLLLLMLALGVYPSPFVRLAQAAVMESTSPPGLVSQCPGSAANLPHRQIGCQRLPSM